MLKKIILAGLAVAMIISTSYAADFGDTPPIPTKINIQGRITPPPAELRGIGFVLSATGKDDIPLTKIPAESSIDTNTGIFNVVLDVSDKLDYINVGDAKITVMYNAEPIMTFPFSSAPYAIRALEALTLAGGIPTSPWTEKSGNVYRLTGNVGIGTDVPKRHLHIHGTENTYTQYTNSNTGVESDDGLVIGVTSGQKAIISQREANDLQLYTKGVERMIIRSGGNVGIGTTTPGEKLSVIGKVRGAKDGAETEYTEIGHGGSHGYINTVGDGFLDFRHDGTTLMSLSDTGNIGIKAAPDSSSLSINGRGSDGTDATIKISVQGAGGTPPRKMLIGANRIDALSYPLYINSYSKTNILMVPEGGKVGIGTLSPSRALDVDGKVRIRDLATDLAYDGYAPVYAYTKAGAVDPHGVLFLYGSDRRLKTNLEKITGALSKVQLLQGYSFNWKNNPNGPKAMGMIAQEVKNVFPETVYSADKEGHLGINYDQYIPVLIEAVKELKAENDSLKARIEKLEAK